MDTKSRLQALMKAGFALAEKRQASQAPSPAAPSTGTSSLSRLPPPTAEHRAEAAAWAANLPALTPEQVSALAQRRQSAMQQSSVPTTPASTPTKS